MPTKRDRMIRYLLNETRLTIETLRKMSDKTIERYYREEKECNAE